MLSNKEVVDIIAAAPRRATAARALVESAVRAWRYKYPTSKVDDCAVVCLFLDTDMEKTISTASNANKSKEEHHMIQASNGNGDVEEEEEDVPVLERSGTCREVNDDASSHEVLLKEEEIDAESEKEWSALEGVSRVNTMINLPRFCP